MRGDQSKRSLHSVSMLRSMSGRYLDISLMLLAMRLSVTHRNSPLHFCSSNHTSRASPRPYAWHLEPHCCLCGQAWLPLYATFICHEWTLRTEIGGHDAMIQAVLPSRCVAQHLHWVRHSCWTSYQLHNSDRAYRRTREIHPPSNHCIFLQDERCSG